MEEIKTRGTNAINIKSNNEPLNFDKSDIFHKSKIQAINHSTLSDQKAKNAIVGNLSSNSQIELEVTKEKDNKILSEI